MMMDTDGTQYLLDVLCALGAGEARSHKGLTVLPLLATDDSPAGYVPLDRAIAGGTLAITEVSPEGSIPYLTVANRGPQPVLIFDGEVLTGTRQNRVCNTTVMVGTGTRILPVSGVEEGRWSRTSVFFSPGTYSAHGPHIDEYIAALGCADDETLTDMTGVAVFFEGRLVCVDIFRPSARFRQLYHKLLRGYALEALILTKKRDFLAENHISTASGTHGVDLGDPIAGVDGPAHGNLPSFMLQLFGGLRDATVHLYPALDLGEDLRLQTASASGAGLIWNGAVVQFSLFPRPAA